MDPTFYLYRKYKNNISNYQYYITLDLSYNTGLKTLDISSTAITALDASKNTTLTTLDYKEGTKITGFSIGRYIVANGQKGVVFYVSGTTTKIVSSNQTSTTWGYQTQTSATSDSDGIANMKKIIAKGISNYPAFKWCRDKGTPWYLPAIDELKAIYKNKTTLNKTLSSVGGTSLGTGHYWSSRECDTGWGDYQDAWEVYFKNGTATTEFRGTSLSVRAIRVL